MTLSQSKRHSYHYRRLLSRVGLYALVLLVLAAFMFPFIFMVTVALKPSQEVYTFPPTLLPRNPTLENFASALTPVIFRYGLNSLFVATLTAIVTIFFAVFSSYAFSRLQFPGRKSILVLIILTQLLPLAVLIVPMYRIMSRLNLINTYPALLIAYLTFTVPVAVWILIGFFSHMPLRTCLLLPGKS